MRGKLGFVGSYHRVRGSIRIIATRLAAVASQDERINNRTRAIYDKGGTFRPKRFLKDGGVEMRFLFRKNECFFAPRLRTGLFNTDLHFQLAQKHFFVGFLE